MNRFVHNGATLNGGGIAGLVLATALILCSAGVSATAIRVVSTQATVSADATVTPVATYNHTTAAANAPCEGILTPVPTHIHKGVSTLGGDVNILAYVQRQVDSSVTFNAVADIIAVVASTQGSAALTNGATLTAGAVRIQPGSSNAAGSCQITITPQPTVTRNAIAPVSGQASVRVEATLNNKVDAYSDISGTANVTVVGLAVRCTTALFDTYATSTATGTLIQPGSSVAAGAGVVIIGEPAIEATLISYLTGSAEILAVGVVNQAAIVAIDGVAAFLPAAVQQHSTNSNVTAGVVVTAVATSTYKTESTGSGDCSITVESTRVAMGEAAVSGAVDITANLNIKVLANVDFLGSAAIGSIAEDLNTRRKAGEGSLLAKATVTALCSRVLFADVVLPGEATIVCIPDITIRQGTSVVTTSAEASGEATLTRHGQAFSTGVADVAPVATRITNVTAAEPVVVNATASVFADTIANPTSLDPEERTFIRPASVVEFIRPFIETEFKRAA